MTGSTERSATTRSRKSQLSNPDGAGDAIALDPKRFVNRELSWLAFNDAFWRRLPTACIRSLSDCVS